MNWRTQTTQSTQPKKKQIQQSKLQMLKQAKIAQREKESIVKNSITRSFLGGGLTAEQAHPAQSGASDAEDLL